MKPLTHYWVSREGRQMGVEEWPDSAEPAVLVNGAYHHSTQQLYWKELAWELLDRTAPEPNDTAAHEVLDRAEQWDRCYPGNVSIGTLVSDLVRELRARVGSRP